MVQQQSETANYAVMKEEGIDLAGGVYFWQFNGTASAANIRRHAELHGFPAEVARKRFPSDPTAAVCLSRAVRDVCGSGHIVKKVTGTPWTQVTLTRVADGDLEFKKELKVKLVNDEPIFEEHHHFSEQIRSSFNANNGVLHGSDMTEWLVNVMKGLHGVTLKRSGGFYFLPEGPDREMFEQIIGVLRAASSHQFFSMPVVRNEDVLDAIQSGIVHEAQSVCDEISRVLEEEELGTRGLKSRSFEAQAALHKLQHYEELLGRGLDEVKHHLLKVSGKLVDVALASDRGEANPYDYA